MTIGRATVTGMHRAGLLLMWIACTARSPVIREEPVTTVAATSVVPDAASDPALDAPDVAVDAAVDAAPAFESAAFEVEVQGQGRPIILIPGLGCPSSVWDTTVAHLSQSAETHVLALAGFAGRPPISGPLESTVRSELARYIRARGLDHPVVIGHSLGGVIAFWLAATEPALVGPTIIVDAAPQMFGETRLAAVQARADRWRRMTDPQFAAAVAEYFGGMSNDRVALAPIVAAVARSDRRAFSDAIVELATVDLRPLLGAIRAPVFAIVADGRAFAEVVSRQMAAIPDRQLRMLRGTRHFVFLDDPATFFREVDAFLAAHP